MEKKEENKTATLRELTAKCLERKLQKELENSEKAALEQRHQIELEYVRAATEAKYRTVLWEAWSIVKGSDREREEIRRGYSESTSKAVAKYKTIALSAVGITLASIVWDAYTSYFPARTEDRITQQQSAKPHNTTTLPEPAKPRETATPLEPVKPRGVITPKELGIVEPDFNGDGVKDAYIVTLRNGRIIPYYGVIVDGGITYVGAKEMKKRSANDKFDYKGVEDRLNKRISKF